MTKCGQLIVFEGPDGVGKTTLARALATHFSDLGIPSDYSSLPGERLGTLGRHIYQLHHNSKEFHVNRIDPASLQTLHIAAHIEAVSQVIIPALQSGRTVVLDRFWWSVYVYGKVSGIQGNLLDAMVRLEQILWHRVLPSMVFLVHRKSPLCPQPSKVWWNEILQAYLELPERENSKYPVRLIENEGAVADALLTIVGAVAEQREKQCKKFTPNNLPDARQVVSHQSCDETQIALDFSDEAESWLPTVITGWAPAKPTEVFNTYWRFAAERQEIFFRRLTGSPAPWTRDPILVKFKFTNAYRASDRTSQYLIRRVIYEGDQTPEEVFFRIILFKLFNRIETWEVLKNELAVIRFSEYRFERYDAILSRLKAAGLPIYSAAYMMPSGSADRTRSKKHQDHLRLLERMMRDGVPRRISEMGRMNKAFELLRSYPMIGDFLGYQFVTDLNYSEIVDFNEMEFVVPGPGARDGIRKCFASLGGLTESNIIHFVAERQEEEFTRLGLSFRTLWGRPLQLIDCQNLFCEVDKYARQAHPDAKGISGRKRIKQHFIPKAMPLDVWYPPKWGLNEHLGDARGE